MRSSTASVPTLVFEQHADGEEVPRLAVGCAGNAWIPVSVYNIITGVIDGRLGAQAAIEAPRFLPGRDPADPLENGARIEIEDRFPRALLQDLIGARPQVPEDRPQGRGALRLCRGDHRRRRGAARRRRRRAAPLACRGGVRAAAGDDGSPIAGAVQGNHEGTKITKDARRLQFSGLHESSTGRFRCHISFAAVISAQAPPVLATLKLGVKPAQEGVVNAIAFGSVATGLAAQGFKALPASGRAGVVTEAIAWIKGYSARRPLRPTTRSIGKSASRSRRGSRARSTRRSQRRRRSRRSSSPRPARTWRRCLRRCARRWRTA